MGESTLYGVALCLHSTKPMSVLWILSCGSFIYYYCGYQLAHLATVSQLVATNFTRASSTIVAFRTQCGRRQFLRNEIQIF